MGAALLVSALGMELLAELRQELVDHGLLIGDLSPESREQLAQGRLVYRAVGIAGQTAVGAGDRGLADRRRGRDSRTCLLYTSRCV